jgi:hypothetical protein
MSNLLLEGIIYQTQISLINNIVDRLGSKYDLDANDLVSKYIYKQEYKQCDYKKNNLKQSNYKQSNYEIERKENEITIKKSKTNKNKIKKLLVIE